MNTVVIRLPDVERVRWPWTVLGLPWLCLTMFLCALFLARRMLEVGSPTRIVVPRRTQAFEGLMLMAGG